MKPWPSMLTSALLAAMVTAASAQTAAKQSIQYPSAHRDEAVNTYFGTRVPAPYQWMEDLDSSALKQWVTAENRLTGSYLAKIPVRDWIEQRLTKLWNYARQSTPDQVKGSALFFTRNAGLQNQSPVYVKAAPDAKPRMLIDPNQLSPNGDTALAGYQPSSRGQYVSYELSEGGSDWQTIHVRQVANGKDLPDEVQWVKFSGVSWTNDGNGFFYSRYPTPPEGKAISQKVVNQKLYYHTLGTPQTADKLIYARPDHPEWIVGGDVSEDGRYVFVFVFNGTSRKNELYYADLRQPKNPDITAKLHALYTSRDATYRPIGHDGDTLFLLTTRDAPRGRIVATKFADPDPAHWKTIVPQGGGVIQNATMADGRILVENLVAAKSQLKLYSTIGKELATLPLPDIGTVRGISARNDSDTLYYSFTSYLFPTTVYRYDIGAGKTSVFFKPDVAFDPSPYQTKQVFYTSKDGTRVPMFIVTKKGVELDGDHPTILYAYGGFDISITPSFNPMLPVWLELGGVYAVANIRGGGEFGETWHKAGMLGNKQNVFDDFAWAARYLISQGYTSTPRLGIQGYSNGGLLVGASITQHADLFGAAYAGAGVMDLLRYQKFSGGALWAPEYGTSDNQKAFQWLIKYSPLQNIEPGTCYPPTIVTTADHDDRVVPSHSYKFVARMQHAQSCNNPILIRVATDTSHGYMPTDKRIEQTADVWAFEAYNLGIKEAPKSGE